MRHWRIYRNLAVIYAVALVFFIAENARQMQSNDVFLKPDNRYTQVINQIYPERNEARWRVAYRTFAGAKLELNSAGIRQDPQRAELALKQWQEELAAAAETYRQTIDGGMVSEEMVFYQYALALMRMQAEPTKIDQAIADWRRHYPFSREPPLEQMRQDIEKGLQSLKEQIRQAKEQQQLEELRRAREKLHQNRSGEDKARRP